MSVIQDESIEGYESGSYHIPAALLTNVHVSQTSSQEILKSGAEDSSPSQMMGPRKQNFLGTTNDDIELNSSKRTGNETVRHS